MENNICRFIYLYQNIYFIFTRFENSYRFIIKRHLIDKRTCIKELDVTVW